MALAITSMAEMWDCIPQSLYGVTSALGDIICTEVRPLAESVLIQVLFSALYTKLLEAAKSFPSPEEPPASDARPQTPSSMSKSAICILLAEASCCIDEDNKHTEAINDLIRQAKERQCADSGLFDMGDENLADAQVNAVHNRSPRAVNNKF